MDGAVRAGLPGTDPRQLDGIEALRAALSADPDVDLVVLDLHMPGAQGFGGLSLLRAEWPDVPVVMISATEDPAVMRRAVAFGAMGFIPKSSTPEQIAEALTAIMAGREWLPAQARAADSPAEDRDLAARLAALTPQQLRVLLMMAQGKLNKQIAYDLDISIATVKAHVTAILRKMGCHSRTQAVILANQISVEDPAASPVPDPADVPEDEDA